MMFLACHNRVRDWTCTALGYLSYTNLKAGQERLRASQD
jgi:hypothetical protein